MLSNCQQISFDLWPILFHVKELEGVAPLAANPLPANLIFDCIEKEEALLLGKIQKFGVHHVLKAL